MKILYIGSAIHPNDIMRFSGPSVAGNKMQLGILKALHRVYLDDLSVLTQIPISQFPREKKIVVKSSSMNLADRLHANSISFLNLPFIKQIQMILHTKREVLKWCKQNQYEEKVILCFNALPQIAKPAIAYQKRFGYKIVTLLADPPIDPIQRGFIKGLFKSLENHMSISTLQFIDGVVALNQKMIDDYTPAQKSVIIEGGLDLDFINPLIDKVKPEQYKIIYSGALTAYSGVSNLIQALPWIKNNHFIIEIYGTGPLQESILESMKHENRLVYKGNVSNQEMMEIQRHADILINPRLIKDPVSMYTFPSKLIEYMASGTPTLTTKVNGLLDEYLPYLFVMEEDTPQAIANAIEKLLNMDYQHLIKTGLEGRTFVMKEKNWEVQTNRLVRFMEEVI